MMFSHPRPSLRVRRWRDFSPSCVFTVLAVYCHFVGHSPCDSALAVAVTPAVTTVRAGGAFHRFRPVYLDQTGAAAAYHTLTGGFSYAPLLFPLSQSTGVGQLPTFLAAPHPRHSTQALHDRPLVFRRTRVGTPVTLTLSSAGLPALATPVGVASNGGPLVERPRVLLFRLQYQQQLHQLYNQRLQQHGLGMADYFVTGLAPGSMETATVHYSPSAVLLPYGHRSVGGICQPLAAFVTAGEPGGGVVACGANMALPLASAGVSHVRPAAVVVQNAPLPFASDTTTAALLTSHHRSTELPAPPATIITRAAVAAPPLPPPQPVAKKTRIIDVVRSPPPPMMIIQAVRMPDPPPTVEFVREASSDLHVTVFPDDRRSPIAATAPVDTALVVASGGGDDGEGAAGTTVNIGRRRRRR